MRSPLSISFYFPLALLPAVFPHLAGVCERLLLGLCQEQLERMWHLAGSNLDGQDGLSANAPRHNRGLDLEKINIYIYTHMNQEVLAEPGKRCMASLQWNHTAAVWRLNCVEAPTWQSLSDDGVFSRLIAGQYTHITEGINPARWRGILCSTQMEFKGPLGHFLNGLLSWGEDEDKVLRDLRYLIWCWLHVITCHWVVSLWQGVNCLQTLQVKNCAG